MKLQLMLAARSGKTRDLAAQLDQEAKRCAERTRPTPYRYVYVATSPVAREGPADEENFVDRPNSVGFCAAVALLQPGAPA